MYDLIEKLLLEPIYAANYQTFLRLRAHFDRIYPEPHRHVANNQVICPLFYPLSYGLKRTVECFISSHPEWRDEPIGKCGTPLIIAAGLNDLGMIQCLLDLGADVNKACAAEYWIRIVPLHYAVHMANFEATELLIKNGADLDTSRCKYYDADPNSENGNPLELIWKPISTGHYQLVKTLLAAGVKLGNLETKAEALQWAINGASLETVKIFTMNMVCADWTHSWIDVLHLASMVYSTPLNPVTLWLQPGGATLSQKG